MMQPNVSSGPDLSKCAEEQIHIPGAIQPHGALLVVTESNMQIVQVSESVGVLFGVTPGDLLGKALETLIGSIQQRQIQQLLAQRGPEVLNPLALKVGGQEDEKLFNAVMHRVDDVLVIELEPSESELPVDAIEFFRTGYAAITESLQSCSTQELYQRAADYVSVITGFDHIMVYLFDKDWNGTVVAECANELERYLGLVFPASDIPAQARQLYARNSLRLLVDVNAGRSRLIPANNPVLANPLDLSGAILRSMSEVHIEYLKNMGVAASMSISIMANDELKGLIACHHPRPKHVTYQQRQACDFLAKLISLKSVSLAERENFRNQNELRVARKEVVSQLAGSDDISECLNQSGQFLLQVAGARGVAVVWDGQCKTFGLTPTSSDLEQLVAWLREDRHGVVRAVESLSEDFEPANSYRGIASGLLAVKLTSDGTGYLLWFRPEQVQEINWAGDPEKPVEPHPSARIHPRKSFEVWKQQVTGRALPWLSAEIESALELRMAVLDVALSLVERKRAQDLQLQVSELNRLNQELEALSKELGYARDAAMDASRRKSEMVSVVSHDLRAPLTSMKAALGLLSVGVHSAAASRELIDLAHRSSGYMLALINGLLDLDKLESGSIELNKVELKVSDIFQQTIELLTSTARVSDTELRALPTELTVLADNERIIQTAVNLVANAIKFSPVGGFVELSAVEDNDAVTVNVRDNGRGVPEVQLNTIFDRFTQVETADYTEKGGAGLGLSISKALVEAHGGTIGVDSEVGKGSTFWFRLPKRI